MEPLNGIKVLDLSRLAPGPFGTMILGDLGADVLSIEPPPDTKVPPMSRGTGEQAIRQAAFNSLRRNKRAMILNLKVPEGHDIFMRLAKDADVVQEGFRPGVVKRLGVDYDSVCKVNPNIIYCSLSGYGQSGPYVDRVGHDINYVAVAGALSMFGWPGMPPQTPLNLLGDYAGGGLTAAMSIIAALFARERGAGGQYIDIAMSDGVMYLMAAIFNMVLSGAGAPKRGEHQLAQGMPWYNVFETSDDRWISIGSLEPHFYANLCKALEIEEFLPYQHDLSKKAEMYEVLKKKFREHTMAYWSAKLAETDICVGPVLTPDEALVDPQNSHRQMLIEVNDPTLGVVKQVGIGPKFSKTPGSVRSLGHIAGRDTDAVLQGLGYSESDIARLRSSGIVA